MRRGVFDVLRRGFDNALANWPLVLIRVFEMFVLLIAAIAAMLVVVVPILVAVGIEAASIRTPDDVFGAAEALLTRWTFLIWIVAAVSVVLMLFVAVHAFVEAGCARVYVDGDRIAGAPVEGTRSRYDVFSFERWFAGARDGWWPVFWIYNATWGVAGLIMLIPLLPTLALTLFFGDRNPGVAVGFGCVGLLVSLLFMMVVGVVTTIWSNRAIAGWAARHGGFRDSVASAWRSVRADFGRHLLVALALVIVSMAGSAFFSSFSVFATAGEMFGRDALVALFTMPLRLLATLCSTVFSALMSGWFLASYAALAIENESGRPVA